MTSEPPKPHQPLRCPHCQATQSAGSTVCWLCGQSMPVVAELADSNASHPIDAIVIGDIDYDSPYASPRSEETVAMQTFRLVDILLLSSAICVLLGLYRVAPGAAIAVGAVLLPVLVRTVLVLRIRESRQLPTSGSDKLLFVVGSLLTAVGLYFVATVASIVAVFAALLFACGGMLLGNRTMTDRFVTMAMVGIAVPLTIAYFIIAVRIIRKRWRRDTGH